MFSVFGKWCNVTSYGVFGWWRWRSEDDEGVMQDLAWVGLSAYPPIGLSVRPPFILKASNAGKGEGERFGDWHGSCLVYKRPVGGRCEKWLAVTFVSFVDLVSSYRLSRKTCSLICSFTIAPLSQNSIFFLASFRFFKLKSFVDNFDLFKSLFA